MMFKSGWQKITNSHVNRYPALGQFQGHWVKLKVTKLGAEASVEQHKAHLCEKCEPIRGR